jgi:putative intracellular protease/amidase
VMAFSRGRCRGATGSITIKASGLGEMPPGKAAGNRDLRSTPVGLIGPAVAALLDVRTTDDKSLVNERRITGMTLSEYNELHRGNISPIAIEDEIVRLGGIFCRKSNNSLHVERDGNLVTGQNQQSAGRVAREVIDIISAS